MDEVMTVADANSSTADSPPGNLLPNNLPLLTAFLAFALAQFLKLFTTWEVNPCMPEVNFCTVTGHADDDDSDLDLASKMLDVARVISEKQLVGDTMEKVDILSALAEVALEREDIESSLGDYQKALAILLRIVEPDSRQIAELNFRICMCLELGSKPLEAIPYCQNAISLCKSRMQRLTNETKSSVSAASAVDNDIQQSNSSKTSKLGVDREADYY